MSQWDILEITQTDDLSIIKKAYAKKLKTNHPEDNPKGFQTLKEAYDYAVKYAKSVYKYRPVTLDIDEEKINENQYSEENYINENCINNDISRVTADNNIITDTFENEYDFIENSNETDADKMHSFSYVNTTVNMPFDWKKANNIFLDQLEALYSDFFERIKIENWARLLNQDVLWNIENKANLEPIVLSFLSTHYYLPQNIWRLLDEGFNLHNRERVLNYEYGELFTKHVIKVLSQPFPLNYNYMSKVDGLQYDLYFELKEKIYHYLEIKDSREAEKFLNQAKQLYKGDPDLTRMAGIINFMINKFDYSIALFNEALTINPDDLESLYYRANISFIKNNFSGALNDLNIVLSALPYHQNSILLAINCNLKRNNLFQAQELIIRGLNSVSDGQTFQTLLNLKGALEKKLQFRSITQPWTFKQTNKQLTLLRQTGRQTAANTSFAKKLGKLAIYACLILVAIGLTAVTRVGGIVIVYFIARQLNKKN